MFNPERISLNFSHGGVNYNFELVKGENSTYAVEINGHTYAVLGDGNNIDTACHILIALPLQNIASLEDLKSRIFSIPLYSSSMKKTDSISATPLLPTNQTQNLAIRKAYDTLVHDLQQYTREHLKQGALLVQVVGLKGAEEPLVFGKRSINDAILIKVDQNSIDRTRSGVKLWAALLTAILTTKYSQYIQMEDRLEKFAPQEALKKFSRIDPDDGHDIIAPELAKQISIEGILGMMAGLEYDQPGRIGYRG